MNPKLPGTYVNLLADVLQRKGISNEQLLDGTGISAQKLESSFWYVDFHIFNYLLEKSALLIKEPAIGGYGYDSDYYSLVEKMTIKYMQEIGRKYPNCGYGGMFSQWVFNEDPEPYNSYGNGAAMRVSPAGYAARTESEASRLAEAVTMVTHNHDEGIKGAETIAVAIFMARRGFIKGEIRNRINRDYYPLNFTIDGIRDAYQFNETCQETVPQAIKAFLESTSFEDAIRTAISLGGDSDTLAAITGSIAEAYYGIPEGIKEKALTYLDAELRAIYDEWTVFIGSESVIGL